MIEYGDYPLKQYKREVYGKYWWFKTFFIIISPSAYSAWVGNKRVNELINKES